MSSDHLLCASKTDRPNKQRFSLQLKLDTLLTVDLVYSQSKYSVFYIYVCHSSGHMILIGILSPLQLLTSEPLTLKMWHSLLCSAGFWFFINTVSCISTLSPEASFELLPFEITLHRIHIDTDGIGFDKFIVWSVIIEEILSDGHLNERTCILLIWGY